MRAEQDAADVGGVVDGAVVGLGRVVEPVTARRRTWPRGDGVIEGGGAVEHGHAGPGVAPGEAPESRGGRGWTRSRASGTFLGTRRTSTAAREARTCSDVSFIRS